MAMLSIEGQPGLYRDSVSGVVINVKNYTPWETSDHFEGQDYVFKKPAEVTIVQGCRISFAAVPPRAALQQLAVLMVDTKVEVIATLERWCTDDDVLKKKTFMAFDHIRIALAESPVEGCGLRVHLRGLKYAAV